MAAECGLWAGPGAGLEPGQVAVGRSAGLAPRGRSWLCLEDSGGQGQASVTRALGLLSPSPMPLIALLAPLALCACPRVDVPRAPRPAGDVRIPGPQHPGRCVENGQEERNKGAWPGFVLRERVSVELLSDRERGALAQVRPRQQGGVPGSSGEKGGALLQVPSEEPFPLWKRELLSGLERKSLWLQLPRVSGCLRAS